jgi:hypothetical protein
MRSLVLQRPPFLLIFIPVVIGFIGVVAVELALEVGLGDVLVVEGGQGLRRHTQDVDHMVQFVCRSNLHW